MAARPDHGRTTAAVRLFRGAQRQLQAYERALRRASAVHARLGQASGTIRGACGAHTVEVREQNQPSECTCNAADTNPTTDGERSPSNRAHYAGASPGQQRLPKMRSPGGERTVVLLRV